MEVSDLNEFTTHELSDMCDVAVILGMLKGDTENPPNEQFYDGCRYGLFKLLEMRYGTENERHEREHWDAINSFVFSEVETIRKISEREFKKQRELPPATCIAHFISPLDDEAKEYLEKLAERAEGRIQYDHDWERHMFKDHGIDFN